MLQADLIMKPSTDVTDCWDRLSLTIKGSDNFIPLIIFKNRDSALGTYTQLFAERYSDPKKNLWKVHSISTWTVPAGFTFVKSWLT